MRIARTLGLVALLLALAPGAGAQELASVYGRLTTVEGRGPVAGATVRLVEAATERTMTLRTDEKGRFARLGIRPGRYRAIIEREGFAAVEVVDIEVRSADRVRLNVEMTPFGEAPFRRQTLYYHRPLVNIEDAALGTRILGR